MTEFLLGLINLSLLLVAYEIRRLRLVITPVPRPAEQEEE